MSEDLLAKLRGLPKPAGGVAPQKMADGSLKLVDEKPKPAKSATDGERSGSSAPPAEPAVQPAEAERQLRPTTTTTESGQSFRVLDVNGIRDFTVNLDAPGVVVVKGENGAGKSSLIEAIKGAAGDDKAKVSPTEGEDKGSVEMGGGVVLKIGHKRRRDGQPSVRLVNTSAIGQLIEPGLVDEKAAARARIRALVQLKPMPVDDATRQELTGNDEELQLWIKRDTSSDAMELAQNVRLKGNELALELEKRCAQCEGEEESLTGLIQELGELDYEAGYGATAKAAADAAMKESEVMMHRANERRKLEAQQAEFKGTIGERPDEKPVQLKIDNLQLEISNLQTRIAELTAQRNAECLEVNRILLAQKTWDSQSAILKREVTGPTMAEAEAAVETARVLAAKSLRAEKLDRARAWLEKIEAAKLERTTKADRAKLLRSVAHGTEEALSRLLEKRGLKDLAVVEGRLHWKSPDGRVLDYGSQMVSFGQRVRIALGVALEGIDRDSVESRTTGNRMPLLALNPDFWLALDPARKAEVAAIAKERGVCLITEEPGEGELRVEKI